jgi:RNA polymerase primary sigma factor
MTATPARHPQPETGADPALPIGETPEALAEDTALPEPVTVGEGQNVLEVALAAVKVLVRAGHVPLADVQATVEALETDEPGEEPDIGAVLAALAAQGIEVDEEISETELHEATARAAKLLLAAGAEGELDALAQWQRDALRHPVLTRPEETELTTRYALYAHTAAILGEARTRLEIAITRVMEQVANARELVALMDDPELAGRGRAEATKALTEWQAEQAELEGEAVLMEEEIARARRAAKEAEEVFLAYNFRLVFALAMRKFRQAGRKGDLMDLVQQGNIGMIDAFRKFDPSLGYKFSTFATWHINQALSLWLYERVGTVRVPTHRWRDAKRIEVFVTSFIAEHGRAPQTEEIAEAMGKTVKKIGEIQAAHTLTQVGSLDRPVTDEDGSATVGELASDPAALTPEQLAVRDALRGLFSSAFERILDGRERRVLQLRFGMEDDVPRTLDWIGRRMNITRERVRQIEARALNKLRRDEEIKQMIHLEGGMRRLDAGEDLLEPGLIRLDHGLDPLEAAFLARGDLEP